MLLLFPKPLFFFFYSILSILLKQTHSEIKGKSKKVIIPALSPGVSGEIEAGVTPKDQNNELKIM